MQIWKSVVLKLNSNHSCSYYWCQITPQITRHNIYNLDSFQLRQIAIRVHGSFPTKTSYQADIVFFIWSFFFFPTHINKIYGAELCRSDLWVDRLTLSCSLCCYDLYSHVELCVGKNLLTFLSRLSDVLECSSSCHQEVSNLGMNYLCKLAGCALKLT